MATGYDYTQEPIQNAGQPAGGTTAWNPDDYDFIPLANAPDADAIERDAESREFKDIEPGDHELVVTGFVKAPEIRLKTGWLRGQQVSWESAAVGVRFAKATDRQATITDWFDLPPRDPRQQDAYLNATKAPDGGNPGFTAGKFGHFISRLGFPFAPGAPLPAEACRLGNWVGRRVHATVAMERVGKEGPRMNQQTGMPYPPRVQVKLFSYRPAAPAGSTAGSGQGAPMPAAYAPPSASRLAGAAQQAPRHAAHAGSASASAITASGLGDL